jgi:hypothetical protein
MEQSRIFSLVLAFAAIAVACAPVKAQTVQNASTPQPRQVSKAAPRPAPFALARETSEAALALEFRSYDKMTPQDRDLASDAESSIGERAGFAGLEFNEGKWNYQQIVCSALPNHLFLQFTRNNGTGGASVFSASIPRGNNGSVRIIPILRSGYSLFSPAPINALTISVFNQIRAEEHPEKAPEWLATGLCYAALAGAHPQIGPPEVSEIQKLPASPPGMLAIPAHGGAMIRFTDVAASSRPMEWTMTFDSKGKLLKATHSAVSKSREKVVALTPAEVQGRPVNSEQQTANSEQRK